jgi:hypothetical protein
MVNQRWGWAPGRHVGRPVWAPALVGWVGGSGWSLTFNSRSAPAQGWYPLGFSDQYVPGYRVSHDHLRHINRHARRHDGRRRDDHRRHGLTVVPHEHFSRRAPIVVPNAPHAVVSPLALQAAPVLAPQAPRQGERLRRHRDDAHEPDGQPYRQRRQVLQAPAPVQPQLRVPADAAPQAPQPSELSAGQREWEQKRRAMAEEARRAELEQMRRAQLEEARRGQLDQMRRLQMEEMRRGQLDDMRRSRQGQMQAAPAPAPQAAPAAVEQRRVAPAAPMAAPAPAPQPQMASPAVPQERRAREESPRRDGRPAVNLE